MSRYNKLSRRQMLAALGLGSGALAFGDVVLAPHEAAADGNDILDQNLLVFVYLNGAWDTLLCTDPRDNTVYGNPTSGKAIYTGLDLVRTFDNTIDTLLTNDPSGLIQPPGSNIAFGPAIGRLQNHFADMCVVRGVDMGTLTHEVGRRYFVTGKFPRGVLPSGSGLPTWIASQSPDAADIPNLVVGGMETFNEGLDPKATGLAINGYQDLASVLKPVNELLVTPGAIEDAVAKNASLNHCAHDRLNVAGMIEAYRAGWEKARIIGDGSLWSHFDFVANPAPSSEIDVVYDAFGINKAFPFNDLNGPKGRAAVAAQALTNDLCRAVSVQIQSGLDTHFSNWVSGHSQTLRPGLDAVADLIQFLKDTLDPNGNPYFDRTTVVVMSEFARTPLLNSQNGRDHHLCNSCIVAGNGIEGNQVVGASDPESYDVVAFDFDTQQADAAAESPIVPADVHATVCEAMGISYEHISNQEPRLITAMLQT